MTKNIFITGASRGIGLELTRQYLSGGDRVYAGARNPDCDALTALKSEHPITLTPVALDVTDAASIAAAVGTLGDTPIHLLINNAGIFKSKPTELDTLDESTWLEEFRVNSISPLMVTRALKSNLVAAGSSVVGMMSSKMGSIGDNTSGGDYSYRSSKAALNAVSVSLAKDLAELGISVIAMHPGWVQTDMGGPNALIDVPTSAKGLKALLDKADLSVSGQFFDYSGTALPW